MTDRKTFRQYAVFLLGLSVAALGIALITAAGLGTSPVTSPSYVLSFLFAPSLGCFTFLVNAVCFLGQVALLGRRLGKLQLLQLPATFVFSACIDLFMLLLSPAAPTAYPARLAMLLCGCAVLGLGVSLEVASDALILPGEGIVRALSQRLGAEFGCVKTAFDLSMVLGAALISLGCLGTLVGVREGTVIAALTVGSFSRLFRPATALLTRGALHPPAGLPGAAAPAAAGETPSL